MEERKRKAGKKKRLGMTLATCGAAEDKVVVAVVVVVIASININHASNLAVRTPQCKNKNTRTALFTLMHPEQSIHSLYHPSASLCPPHHQSTHYAGRQRQPSHDGNTHQALLGHFFIDELA